MFDSPILGDENDDDDAAAARVSFGVRETPDRQKNNTHRIHPPTLKSQKQSVTCKPAPSPPLFFVVCNKYLRSLSHDSDECRLEALDPSQPTQCRKVWKQSCHVSHREKRGAGRDSTAKVTYPLRERANFRAMRSPRKLSIQTEVFSLRTQKFEFMNELVRKRKKGGEVCLSRAFSDVLVAVVTVAWSASLLPV